uniref:Si:dkey-234h16.7 n=1 Tax=Fundulus heteroclitus TaxID=8078 RepID=A0A3Q2PJL3_FUNHE
VLLCFSAIISAQDDSSLTERPYVVLQKQNLTLGSVLAVLLLLMIIMAVCVY